MDEQETGQIAWREIVALLFRRRKLILGVFVSGLATAALIVSIRSPVYRATATLMVTSQRARITVSPDPKSAATVDRLTDEDLNSEVALLSSPALVREVLAPDRDQIGTTKETGWGQQLSEVIAAALDLPARFYRSLHGVPPLNPFEKLVLDIAPYVVVAPVSKSNLIEVSYASADPQWTADFVNRLAERHVERRAEMNQQAETLGFLESQRRLLNDKLRAAEDALANFYAREAIDATPEQRTTLHMQLTALESTLANSTTELAEGAARAAFLSQEIRSGRAVWTSTSPQADPLLLLKTRLVDLELQRSELLTKFAPGNAKVQDLDSQIEEARRLLAVEEKTRASTGGNGPLQLDLTQTQVQLAAVRARIDALRPRIASARTALAHLDQIASEQERLDEDVAAAKEAFLTYSKKAEEARFSDALDTSQIVNVTIAERAEVPVEPEPSKSVRILAVAAIMSLFAGVGLAFARDRLDPAVKSSSEAQRVTGLPILADIPT
ncbi:MAG: GumC family protein [Candidatus Binatia bacterium]|jgi:uncharacterized protein involved in exopolysaccharide biosynthesis